MRYPRYILEQYAEWKMLLSHEERLIDDEDSVEEYTDLQDNIAYLEATIEELCANYASETGADLELDFDEDAWIEDLERQYREEY